MVERLIDVRTSIGKPAGDTHRMGVILYKVLWKGLGEEDATWEPKSYLTPQLIEQFEEACANRLPAAFVEDLD